MAVFEYRGIVATNGKQVQGVRDADNAKALRAVLKREGILLTGAHETVKSRVGVGRKSRDAGSLFRRVSVADVSMMTRQLATLVNAGIPLVEAVGALIEQVDKIELKRVLTQVVDRLNEGSSLAKALEPHSHVFSNLYVSMVAAGEASGTLEAVLERLADFMESQSKLRGKVGAALAYPALMVVIGSALITVMMVVVVPKVTAIFESLDRALPWYTQALIGASHLVTSNQMLGFVLALVTFTLTRSALRDYKESERAKHMLFVVLAPCAGGLLVLAAFMAESFGAYALGAALGVGAALAIAWLTAWLATPEGRMAKDGFMLRMPVFGPLVQMLAVSRFARTLATLLRSGVPLLKAMDIVKNVLDNGKLEKVIETAAGSIREGESIAGPLKRSGNFPPIVTHMIAVGERSGQLEQMLENVARAYDSQVETRVQALTSLLEPLMIVVMGGGVGFIAFAILMPLIQMNEFAQ
ncbi:MAG TPA: type II secretion system F family protein [Polyangiaceae bacterium]|nr:type II secretion system F family protein [Polyangiaceae bacterium]